MSKPKIAYILDPRFPGGTSSAVAAELDVVRHIADIVVHAQSTSMFKGREPAPQLQDALLRMGLPVVWDAPEIAADIAVFHNPSCLRFQTEFKARIIAHHLIVVAHENFLRPSGSEAFDVHKCLHQLDVSTYASKRTLAPISAWNRQTITDWSLSHGPLGRWDVLDVDWFNICHFPLRAPTSTPQDRRGRLSRPGLEKFPQNDVLAQCFPAHAQSNVILGADALIAQGDTPPHWQLLPFRAIEVDEFFEAIDFMIYFTAPTFRESFGRVMAEAVAAGKIVISDTQTARIFGGAVLSATPDQVDSIINGYLNDPARYAKDVRAAQRKLKAFSPDAFKAQIGPRLVLDERDAA